MTCSANGLGSCKVYAILVSSLFDDYVDRQSDIFRIQSQSFSGKSPENDCLPVVDA